MAQQQQHKAGLAAYLEEVRAKLRPALCLHNFPSQEVERHNKPEVELRGSPELLLPPVQVVRRGCEGGEDCLIEQSVNSARVSFRFRSADPAEEYLARTLLRFMMHRADQLEVVRRVPLPGYDLTFLVTNFHLEHFHRDRLIDFICQFVEEFHGEVQGMKLGLKTRARAVVEAFWQLAEQQQQQEHSQQQPEEQQQPEQQQKQRG